MLSPFERNERTFNSFHSVASNVKEEINCSFFSKNKKRKHPNGFTIKTICFPSFDRVDLRHQGWILFEKLQPKLRHTHACAKSLHRSGAVGTNKNREVKRDFNIETSEKYVSHILQKNVIQQYSRLILSLHHVPKGSNKLLKFKFKMLQSTYLLVLIWKVYLG